MKPLPGVVASMMTLFVGTSGWQYDSWRKRFYPEELVKTRWLEHYAARFRVVEINNTFYRLPNPHTFAEWARRTPADFVFVPKVSRYLTHVKRLREPEEPVRRFLDHAAPLGTKLGPVLVQLPPTLTADVGHLDATLRLFPSTVRVAVEFRHPSWFSDEVRLVLESHSAALCLADRHSQSLSPLWRTADWVYLRLHEGRASPHPCYGQEALAGWAGRLLKNWGSTADAYVFFNNDGAGCAVRDAIRFAAAARRIGLDPTRVPEGDEVTVG